MQTFNIDLCFSPMAVITVDLNDPRFFRNEVMNSNSTHCRPSVIQSLTPTILKPGEPNTKTVNDFTERHFSHEWTEYDDFPSSEDLSAFLADLERDALGKEDGQTIPSLPSMATEVATLKDVCEITHASNAEDFTEFTDFPSSEDLDEFLADMELESENMLMRKSLTSRTTKAYVAFLNSKPHGKVEGSKCVAIKGHAVEDIGNTNSTKVSSESPENKVQTSSDMGHGSDSSWVQEKAMLPSTANCASFSDEIMHGSDCSDSQLLRDCESVFADKTENMRIDGEALHLGKSTLLLKRANLSSQGRSILQNGRDDVNNVSTRRSKPFCRSRSTEEFHEKDIVCNTPLRNEQTEIMRSRDDDRNANETIESQQGDRLTTMDHHGNSGVLMLNESCDMMTSAPFSPDLFSQSLSVVEGCSKTADLFSFPRLGEGETRSRSTHGSATPDLFSPPTSFAINARSCSKEELHSVPLFSSSECSHMSSESPALLAVCENEAASLLNISHRDTENESNRSSLLFNLHSTPYGVCLPSRMLSKPWTPIQVSPLVASAGSNRCNDINLQGTPVLFSQLSNSSL